MLTASLIGASEIPNQQTTKKYSTKIKNVWYMYFLHQL